MHYKGRVEVFYNLMGRFFTPFMILGQATIPFYVMYRIRKMCKYGKISKDRIQAEAITSL